jgi:hypothetical protein
MNELTSWGTLFRSLVFWGPGAVLAVVIVLCLYKLAGRFLAQFIGTQEALAIATAKQADSMEGMRDAVQAYVTKDNLEHKEILVLLKYIAQHQELYLKVCREHEECMYCKHIG